MRRRLVVLALVLDTLGAVAVAAGLPFGGAAEADRYAVVAGACVEVLDAGPGTLAGRVVADDLCD
jgi:hypothetical protein